MLLVCMYIIVLLTNLVLCLLKLYTLFNYARCTYIHNMYNNNIINSLESIGIGGFAKQVGCGCEARAQGSAGEALAVSADECSALRSGRRRGSS
jgi:hypothetical protein